MSRPEPLLPAGVASAIMAADVVTDVGIGQALQGLQSTTQTLMDVAGPLITDVFDAISPIGQLTKAQLQASDPWLFSPIIQPSRNKRALLQQDEDVGG